MTNEEDLIRDLERNMMRLEEDKARLYNRVQDLEAALRHVDGIAYDMVEFPGGPGMMSFHEHVRRTRLHSVGIQTLVKGILPDED